MVPFLFIPLTEVQNPKFHLYYGSFKFPLPFVELHHGHVCVSLCATLVGALTIPTEPPCHYGLAW